MTLIALFCFLVACGIFGMYRRQVAKIETYDQFMKKCVQLGMQNELTPATALEECKAMWHLYDKGWLLDGE